MAKEMDLGTIYQRRFGPDVAFRQRMWQTLCHDFFQQFVAPESRVLEVGSGYCEFINNITAREKIAVDLNADTRQYADDGVRVLISPSTDLTAIAAGSVDVAFASNFFEHLERPDIVQTMREVARVLRPGGRFLVLQPNYRYCYRDYWMFFDHITALDQHSLAEALETSGFSVVKSIVRFLPYTTKSRLPKSTALIKIYLRLPVLWRIFGQQTFVIAQKNA
jgi:SAM-dependent methyltransferase